MCVSPIQLWMRFPHHMLLSSLHLRCTNSKRDHGGVHKLNNYESDHVVLPLRLQMLDKHPRQPSTQWRQLQQNTYLRFLFSSFAEAGAKCWKTSACRRRNWSLRFPRSTCAQTGQSSMQGALSVAGYKQGIYLDIMLCMICSHCG